MHRDLKPANILLSKSGLVKLGDFNVSKVVSAEDGLLRTQTGTPYYACPEVWQDKPYGFKSDIWSLGCVMYELAALRPPFKAENMAGLSKKVTQGYYPPLPAKYSQELSSVIGMMIRLNPAHRLTCE